MVTMATPLNGKDREQSGGHQLSAAVTRLADVVRGDSADPDQTFWEPARQALKAAREAERRLGDQETRIAHLDRLARWDPLTGVLNRRGFEDEFDRVLVAARRHGETGVLVYVDVDDFGRINHINGHGTGDDVLRYVARSLVAGVRDTDYVARVGDDKFAVLLTRTEREDGIARAEALDQALNNTAVPWMDDHVVVRVSLGIQVYRTQDRSDEILARADTSMTRAKCLRKAIRAERNVTADT
jgi:diguanylate cyclase (GGDEF)-like protein